MQWTKMHIILLFIFQPTVDKQAGVYALGWFPQGLGLVVVNQPINPQSSHAGVLSYLALNIQYPCAQMILRGAALRY
jgi:hypothetical protein